MGIGTRITVNFVLVGDQLGQIKLVQLNPALDNHTISEDNEEEDDNWANDRKDLRIKKPWATLDSRQTNSISSSDNDKEQSPAKFQSSDQRSHKIIRILDDCLQREPAISRAITNIRPIENCHEPHIDTVDRPNNLFLISNRIGQLFICDTDAIRARLNSCAHLQASLTDQHHYRSTQLLSGRSTVNSDGEVDTNDDYGDCDEKHPMLSPVYYNMNNRVPIVGAQPVNQTNILVIYKNGDIQHVNIGQEVLQSTLKIKRKAIRMLGLGYNSDAKAVHWRIDGSSGLCYFNTDATTTHMDENDPLTDIVLSSPTHKLTKESKHKSRLNLYREPPSVHSRKCNQLERLVPTQVINMVTSRANHTLNSTQVKMCRWTSVTSLNLIYRKLALYDLVGSECESDERNLERKSYCVTTYKLNGDRLAVGGCRYAARIYDVQTQKPIYNLLTGAKKNPVTCSAKGEPAMIGDLDWLGGNKTTGRMPNMLATCSGIDSIVNVYDMRCVKPIYHIDLTYETADKWMPYENHHRGAIFTSICASGAPSSTVVPSQQLVLGSTSGQLHLVDLRFRAKSQRHLGRMSGFSGGLIGELRFVSESFETSKVLSCSNDRFMRIHRVQTAYTSFLSQRLAAKVFLSTKPTCIQPICDEITTQDYLSYHANRYASESYLSTFSADSWSRF